MLKTRVITALVLVALLLPAMFYLPQSYWALAVAAFIGVGAWEWGALIGWHGRERILLGIAGGLICGIVSLIDPDAIGASAVFTPTKAWVLTTYGMAVIFWCLVMPFWLKKKWPLSGLTGLLVGAVVLFPTWLAMVQLRTLGPSVLLAIFAVVWMADVAAYFSGKAFGKHKLAPSISPGKTWEGAIGACFGVVAYGLVMRQVFAVELMSLGYWVLALLVVTAISVIGDLYESLLKRKAGIKDSSNVLPGHGGILDRIDSLTSTLPVVAFFWLLIVSSRP